MVTHDIAGGLVSTMRKDNETLGLPTDTKTDVPTQLVISVTLGLGSFVTFCILRPRWSTLYAARKKKLDSAASLPDLPKSFFGWIPVLWRVTDEQVLASAGLDAFVFLSFFQMAITFLAISSVLTLGVLMPIHSYFRPRLPKKPSSGSQWAEGLAAYMFYREKGGDDDAKLDDAYLWVYLIFVYVFTGLALFLLLDRSRRVLGVRQQYLGNRVTVTDRTVKLSGIPEPLRSEAALKEYMEDLGIGKVDSVTVCRNWAELDNLMEQRRVLVRRLEEAYTISNRWRRTGKVLGGLPVVQAEPEQPRDEEGQPLLNGGARCPEDRPKIKIWHGFLKLRSKVVDAIDHYTVRLEVLDAKILEARQKEYEPKPVAFVTMESVASAQVAIQAVLDPNVIRMASSPAPAPPNIVWRNTYRSHTSRLIYSWGISIFVSILSIVWLIPVTGLAGLLNVRDIRRVWPGLADMLEHNDILSSLVRSTLPTTALTLLSVSVPYCYEWISNRQGYISQGDVELSLISKNFFFTFFNLFFAFTALGFALTFNDLWQKLKGSLSDTTLIAYTLAGSLVHLASFYENLVILQGIGMLPLRLLQFGSVALYPVAYVGAKTPRDFEELTRPPTFSYGFYLPQPMLIFIICIVYSVLPSGGEIIVFGLIYFIIGYFTYKYQLLYAMDHSQHSTGQVWSMIFYRVILGLIVFQLAMAGFLAVNHAFVRSLLVLPLLLLNVWLSWLFSRKYVPLNKFIALKAVVASPAVGEQGSDGGSAGERFVNPSLLEPLEPPWVGNVGNGRG